MQNLCLSLIKKAACYCSIYPSIGLKAVNLLTKRFFIQSRYSNNSQSLEQAKNSRLGYYFSVL